MDTPLLNGLFVFVLGLFVVFLGMLIIILAVHICGKVMNKSQEDKQEPKIEIVSQPAPQVSDEVPPHINAVIVAVISAYYFENKSNCDFVVKKIKRI